MPNSSGSGSPPPSSRTSRKESPKRNPPLAPDIILSESMKGHWTQEGYEGPLGTRGHTVFHPSTYVDLQPLGLTGSPHCVPRQGSAQVHKSFSKPVALQIRHNQTPSVHTLDADLSTDYRPSMSPEQSGKGSLKCQPTCLRQRKYSQSAKDQGEDVHGACLRPVLERLKARFPPEHPP